MTVLTGRKKEILAEIIDKDFFLMVVLLGLEPRRAEPESAVLPLHHRTI